MSLDSPYVLVIVALLWVILVLSLCARHYATKTSRALFEIAKKHKGKVKIDSFSTTAKVVFPYSNTEVTVYQRKVPRKKQVRTCIQCSVELARDLAVLIAGRTTDDDSVARLEEWFIAPQVDVGSEAFRKTFVIHGSDVGFLKAILSFGVQKYLLAFRRQDPTFFLYTEQQSLLTAGKDRAYKHLLEFSVGNGGDPEKVVNAGLEMIDAVFRPYAPVLAH